MLAMAIAGCSSGPSKQDSQASATAARTQMVSQIHSLYLKFYDEHFAWGNGVSGAYQSCPSSSQQDEVSYYIFFDALMSFSYQINSAGYVQQAKALAQEAGWKYTNQQTGANGAIDYFLSKAGYTVRLSVDEVTAKKGDYSVLTSWGPCFNAGSQAQSLKNGSQDYTWPKPNPLPSPPASSAS
jgi:hypothetical protein